MFIKLEFAWDGHILGFTYVIFCLPQTKTTCHQLVLCECVLILSSYQLYSCLWAAHIFICSINSKSEPVLGWSHSGCFQRL